MNPLKFLFPFFFAILLLSACDNKKAQTDYLMFKLNEVFQLPIQNFAKLEGGDLKIQFTAVAEDSRCPEGVACVWAGQVKIQLSISESATAKTVELTRLGKQKGEAMATVGNYKIYLFAVNPYPKASGKIKASDYFLELIVRVK